MGLAYAFLAGLAQVGWSRSDLSTEPRLQAKLDVHLKRVLLADFLKFLRTHTDQKFILARELEPLMICAFVKDRPLWQVMDGVAEALGCQWKDVQSAWRLELTPESKLKLPAYVAAEKAALRDEVYQKASALAELAATQKFTGDIGTSKTAGAATIEESAHDWAARVIQDPAYYVAGLAFGRTRILSDDWMKFDCPVHFLYSMVPVAYKLIEPPTAAIAGMNQCSAPGPLAERLSGVQVNFRNVGWAGTIQSVMIGQGGLRAQKPLELLRFPRPDNRLSKTPGGKWLLDWESPLDNPDEPILSQPIEHFELKPSPFFHEGRGIEDYLEGLADSTGIPIVSDAFRMPIRGKVAAAGDTIGKWLQSLKEAQKCFVKVRDGRIVVRHGGFWDLREWEPLEESFSAIEALSNPGLDDYADFAFKLAFKSQNIDQLFGWLPFFDSEQVPLTRFDPTPIRDNYLALAAFGQMEEAQRVHILSGGWVNVYRNVMDSTRTVSTLNYAKDSKGRKIPYMTDTTEGATVGADFFVNISAVVGSFYGGHAVGFEPKLLEACWEPAVYRHLWGDSPDDNPEYVKKYDRVSLFHAHYFRLWRAATEGVPNRASRHLTGTFSFFSSVNDVDGVVNEVAIPSSKS